MRMRKTINTFLENMAKICANGVEKEALHSFQTKLSNLQKLLFWDETRNEKISAPFTTK